VSNNNPHYELFQSWGPDHLRVLAYSGQLKGPMLGDAATWLAQRDAEERLRNEASQIEQNQIALSAKKAAWIAAIAAIVAAAVAIIAAFIAGLAWLWPHAAA
jgi:hypothetical protein